MRRLLLVGAVAALASPALAGVTGVTITGRAPLPGDFGAAGAYERITGVFTGELDPADPKNTTINDLALAPRNARGKVEYSADFAIARPVDPAKASGFLFYQTVNRGRSVDLAAGDADGRISVVSGWQGDLTPGPGLMTIKVPIARNRDGSPATARVLNRIIDPPAGARSVTLVAGIAPTVAAPLPLSLDARRATLVAKRSDADAGTPIAATDWAFADCSETPFPGKPDGSKLCLKAGFDAKLAYELIYEAKDPPVLGVGFAATRDLVAFLRRGADTTATPNPLAGQVKWVVGVGVSQAGNFVRSFTHLGFNQAEDGQRVFDAIHPQIAARHTPMNFRFAVPGGAANLYEPGSEGVLWWGAHEDKVRGRPAQSLLDRCNATDTCPKVVETFGSAEFWGLRVSPNLIGLEAASDIPLPANVRRYYFPSTTHGGGGGGFPVVAAEARGRACVLPNNFNPMAEQLRAVTQALQAWVRDGKDPPASVYPTLAKGDLVAPTAQAMGFPALPGAPRPDGMLNPVLIYDFGPDFRGDDVAGTISRLPPGVRRDVTSLVPRVDADGNELAGIKSVQARVPIGSYLGWNVQAAGYYAGEGCGFQGGYIPFANTAAERAARGDPRLSLQERYGDHAGFVAAVRKAAADLAAEGFLLPADAEKIIGQAEASKVLAP